MDHFPLFSSFLMENFHQFYRELLIQKEKALRALHTKSSVIAEEAPELPALTIGHEIQTKFHQLFETFSLEAQNQIGEFAIAHFQEALYVMVCLTDELFLSFSWSGQKWWEEHLMEAQLFHTQTAGEQFYKKLDALLEKSDPVRNDLAMVYLMALSLGFQGRYAGQLDQSPIAWYRHQLYHLIYRTPSTLHHPGRSQLVAAPYEHTFMMMSGRFFPDLQVWLLTFSGLIFVYLVISSLIWYTGVRDLDHVIGQLLSKGERLGLL